MWFYLILLKSGKWSVFTEKNKQLKYGIRKDLLQGILFLIAIFGIKEKWMEKFTCDLAEKAIHTRGRQSK